MDKNKIIAGAVAAVVIVGAGAFYGGMKYDQSTRAAAFADRAGGGGGPGGNNPNGRARRANGGGFIMGEIIAKDDQSITVKLNDGGSKIVFISKGTEVSKTGAGSVSDLAVGVNVMAMGTSSPDGTVIAQMVQIRPAGMSGTRR